MLVPRRDYPLRPHPVQGRWREHGARFNVVAAGRRSGKTEIAKRKLVKRALRGTEFDDARFFAAAPTRDQARAIYWADLKAMVPRALLSGPPVERDMALKLISGSEIWVVGMDRPERIEGRPWDGGVLDEFANMKPGAWGENVRPALSDRNGWCDLIGVPEGRNHYYELAKYAQGDDPEWAFYSWPSSDILDPKEIAAARRQLDELVFQQEYEASFISFAGRAYYAFADSTHTAALAYNPRATLAFCFDFNVEPGVAAVCQEQALPSGLEGTGVIGEVWIPRNSTTPAVCRKLIADWGAHVGNVVCYGDATGGARGSAKVDGSDWDLITRELKATFGDRLSIKVRTANPPERARINAVNSRLKSATGEVRLMVDPPKAPHVVRDLEGVTLLKGGAGELDKKASPQLTHISDALGYYIEREFPVNDRAGGTVKVQFG